MQSCRQIRNTASTGYRVMMSAVRVKSGLDAQLYPGVVEKLAR
jgi:hypothetical protein